MKTRTALVTGTSSGMGLYAAVELARRGVDVIATMRDTRKADQLHHVAHEAGVRLEVCALDVTDQGAGERVEQIATEHGGIDILVNNAGQGSVGTAEELTMDQIRAQLEVNYLGPVRLTKAVLPHMRSAGAGTILTVTSVGGVIGQPFADAYCGAKFAVEGFMQSLAVVMAEFGVRVSVIEPAAVASSFVGNTDRMPATGPYADLLSAYLATADRSFAVAQRQEDAGAAIADAATSDHYRFRHQSSAGATQFAGLSLLDLDGSRVQSYTRGWIRPRGDAS